MDATLSHFRLLPIITTNLHKNQHNVGLLHLSHSSQFYMHFLSPPFKLWVQPSTLESEKTHLCDGVQVTINNIVLANFGDNLKIIHDLKT
jgi:hypothetical protein